MAFSEDTAVPENTSAQALQDVLAAIPAGLIMLDPQVKVSQANEAAVELLGDPLIGVSWLAVVQRAFAPQNKSGSIKIGFLLIKRIY
jgi:two-component system sensor histidine kinase FlrB